METKWWKHLVRQTRERLYLKLIIWIVIMFPIQILKPDVLLSFTFLDIVLCYNDSVY